MKFSSALTFTVLLLFCCNSGRSFLHELLPRSALLSEDGRLDWIGLAAKYGFPGAEERDVITEDGYILALYHIPGDPRRPALLAHGNTFSAYSWLLRGRLSPALALARRGCDVWAVNFRGALESRRHVALDPKLQKDRFYNYSFYEQGVHDLPATIDFVLRETRQKRLLAIAHSTGAANFFAMAAEKPEYNEKIEALISLGPVAFLGHARGLVGSRRAVDAFTEFEVATAATNEFDRQWPVFNETCLGPDGYGVCVEGLTFEAFGPDPRGFEPEFASTFFGHYPDGSSRKMSDHLIQLSRSGKFAKYDYGAERNLATYGVAEAPEFALSNVTMRVALLVGAGDFLAPPRAGRRLLRALPNVFHYQELPYPSFNHLDFVMGRFMPTNLYPHLLKLVEQIILLWN